MSTVYAMEQGFRPIGYGEPATTLERIPGGVAEPGQDLTGLRFAPELEREFRAQRHGRNVTLRRVAIASSLPLIASFALLDSYLAPEVFAKLLLIRFGVFIPICVATLCAIGLPMREECGEALMAFGLTLIGVCVVAMTVLTKQPTNYLYYGGVMLVVFASHGVLNLRFGYACAAGPLVTLLYVTAAASCGRTPWPVLMSNTCFLIGANVIGACASYMLERLARHEFLQSRVIEEERRRSDGLLLNVLPARVAERLKSDSSTIADGHDEVTILFADIVDFTSLCASVPPARLVDMLNRTFICLDELAERHGLEKIKTIGDAYMVAGGLLRNREDHAAAVAEMALDMREAVASLDWGDGRRISLRIGINTGPVVAGVIGATKYTYDLWGDTVNVASRMESNAEPGTVLATEATYRRLRTDYVFSRSRQVNVKGRGSMSAYRLLGRRRGSVSREPESRAMICERAPARPACC